MMGSAGERGRRIPTKRAPARRDQNKSEPLDLRAAGFTQNPGSPHRSQRRRAREFAIQGLYQALLTGYKPEAILTHISSLEGFKRADQDLCTRLLHGVLGQIDKLTAYIVPLLDRPVAELAPVERAILLQGTFELVYMPETPCKVVLNECIELAKTFGGVDGHKYVNGVLDKLATSLRPLGT